MEMRARNRTTPLLADPAIQLVLAWLGLILLGWPVIQIAGGRGVLALFAYVFALWGALVIVLFAVSRSLRRSFEAAEERAGAPGERQ